METGRPEKRSRQHERLVELARPLLEPGEDLGELVAGLPESSAGVGPIGAALSGRAYLLALSSRRTFVAALGRNGRPETLRWAEPFDNVSVEKFKEGPLWTFLDLRRQADDDRVGVWFSRIARSDVRRIVAAVGADAKS